MITFLFPFFPNTRLSGVQWIFRKWRQGTRSPISPHPPTPSHLTCSLSVHLTPIRGKWKAMYTLSHTARFDQNLPKTLQCNCPAILCWYESIRRETRQVSEDLCLPNASRCYLMLDTWVDGDFLLTVCSLSNCQWRRHVFEGSGASSLCQIGFWKPHTMIRCLIWTGNPTPFLSWYMYIYSRLKLRTESYWISKPAERGNICNTDSNSNSLDSYCS